MEEADVSMTDHAVEYEAAKDVLPLRGSLGKIVTTQIVSARDIPDIGSEEDYFVILVKLEGRWFADTVIVTDGSKPKKDDVYRIYPGVSFPLARKIA